MSRYYSYEYSSSSSSEANGLSENKQKKTLPKYATRCSLAHEELAKNNSHTQKMPCRDSPKVVGLRQ